MFVAFECWGCDTAIKTIPLRLSSYCYRIHQSKPFASQTEWCQAWCQWGCRGFSNRNPCVAQWGQRQSCVWISFCTRLQGAEIVWKSFRIHHVFDIREAERSSEDLQVRYLSFSSLMLCLWTSGFFCSDGSKMYFEVTELLRDNVSSDSLFLFPACFENAAADWRR